VHAFNRARVAEGAQAYIVYPLVEESEKVDLAAATEEYERLRADVFRNLSVALVHGRLPAAEKDSVMRRFAEGAVDVLVATTVIEVGIDVPNASVMVIEHAERFGLSQLHQLRGRVGRGAEESYCVLIAASAGDGAERLDIMARTTDGFEIAREDLRIRGMGDFFGARQHGAVEFRHLDPERDEDLLLRARDRARAIVRADPELRAPEHAAFARALEARYGERERLFDVG
jgi:ATP-dependent DNA helicase RecG